MMIEMNGYGLIPSFRRIPISRRDIHGGRKAKNGFLPAREPWHVYDLFCLNYFDNGDLFFLIHIRNPKIGLFLGDDRWLG